VIDVKAVAYIRVSTKEQDENVQKAEIEKFARQRGIEILEWYIDKGESGAKPFKDRPEANRLLQDLDRVKPDAVVVFAIDRVGRTMLDTVQTILELESKGIFVQARGKKTLKEEMPDAYKDVAEVVDVVHGAGLALKVARLRPLAVIKG